MATKITFHSKKSNRTTTLKTERNPIESDKVYTLVGPSSELLTDSNVYEHISKVETPFLLGIPRIISPLLDQVVTDDLFINFEVSEAIFSREFIGQLSHLEWQIAEDEKFENLIYSKKIEYTNNRLLPKKDINLNVLVGHGYIRARYHSGNIASPFTQPLRFKVANKVILKPNITVDGTGVNVTFKVSNFSINTESGRDIHKSTLYKLFKIPKDDVDFINSYYAIDEKYLILETKKTIDDPNVNNLIFPDIYHNEKINLKAGEHIYVVQARHRGELYTSEISYAIVNASGLKVKTPDLEIRNNELTPRLYISPFAVGTGSDVFKEYNLSLFVIEDNAERLVHNKILTENEYEFPDGVISPSKRYRVEVIARGVSYVESDPGTLSFTMPYIGIAKPLVNLQNQGMEPKFTLSPFKTVNCLDSCVGAEWELYTHDNIIDDNLESVTSLIRTYFTEPHLDSLQVIKSQLEPNTNYIMKVRYVGNKYKSPWAAVNFKSANLEIEKPKVTATVDGLIINLDITSYKLKGATDIGREVEYIISRKNINNIDTEEYIPLGEPIRTKYIKKNISIGKKEGITKDSKYKITGKIIGEYFSSPISDPVYIITDNIYIKIPSITLTGYPNKVPERPLITTSKFEVSADEDKHVSTSYIIKKKTNQDLELVYESIKDTKNLTSLILPKGLLKPKTLYTLTVIHHGELYESSEPITIEFETREHFLFVPEDGADGMQVVKVGEDKDDNSPKYYGTIPFEKLNNDRNYLGDWDGSKIYEMGEQVLYEGKLYYSTKNKNQNKRPDLITQEGVRYWLEDHRTELPTYKWVMKHIGFPVSQVDYGDNLSMGIANVGIYRPNLNSNVVKVAIDGRILYVYDKCELTNICYNDLVKIGIHGTRNRTIRISDRLYYIRTLTSRELHYFNILKILDKENLIDIDIRTSSYVADTDQFDPTFRLVNNEFYKTEQVNGFERSQSFRLVLEYIPEEEEPWLYFKEHLPNLIYDKYTDTGYIGHIDYKEGFNIYDELGIYKGTRINRDAGYLDFYYHGKRLIVNRMPIVYGVSFNDVLEWGAVYDKDMLFSGTYKPISIDNFPVGDRTIAVYPRLLKGGTFALGDQGAAEDNLIKATQNIARYSEWNELLYRISELDPKWVDNNYSHGGFQIGSNWATYDHIGVGVDEYYSGNGCYCYVQCSANGNEAVSRGGLKLENIYWVSKDVARNDHGVRLAFEDSTIYIPYNKIPENKPEPPMSWVPINPDTVVKTDPIDLFPVIDITVNNENTDFKVYSVNSKHKDKFNNDLILYTETNNNILSSKILDKITFVKFNSYYYVIEKVETFNPLLEKHPNNLFIKTVDSDQNEIYNYTNKPSISFKDNIVMLYFGTETDSIILTLGQELLDNSQLDQYLINNINGSGNGNNIINYSYTICNIKTPRSAIYEGLKYQMAPGIINELMKFEITNGVFDVEKCISFNSMNALSSISSYTIAKVPFSLIEHVNDNNLKFITTSRLDIPRLMNIMPGSDELWMLDYNNKLYQIVNIISNNSNNGLYTIEGFDDPERVQNPYVNKDEKVYLFPNADTIYRKANRFFIYQGYRIQYLNGVETDYYLDIDTIGNGISDTPSIKKQFMIDNNYTKMKVMRIVTIESGELAENKFYQIFNIVTTDYDIDTIIPVTPSPSPDETTNSTEDNKDTVVEENGSNGDIVTPNIPDNVIVPEVIPNVPEDLSKDEPIIPELPSDTETIPVIPAIPETNDQDINTGTLNYIDPRDITEAETIDALGFPVATSITWNLKDKSVNTNMVSIKPNIIKNSDAEITTTDYERLYYSLLNRSINDNQTSAYLIPKQDIKYMIPDYESDRELFMNSLTTIDIEFADKGYGLNHVIDKAKIKAVQDTLVNKPVIPNTTFFDLLKAYRLNPEGEIKNILTLIKDAYASKIPELVNLVNESLNSSLNTIDYDSNGKLMRMFPMPNYDIEYAISKGIIESERDSYSLDLNSFESELESTFITDDVDLYNIAYLSYFYKFLFYPEKGYMVKPI